MNKKILAVLVLFLVVSFGSTALASLTFTTDAITGTAASSIDLGAGNTLSLQTTSNAPITTGTGMTTLGGNLTVAGLTDTRIPFVSTGGLIMDDSKLYYTTGTSTLQSDFLKLVGVVPSNGSRYPLNIVTSFPSHTGAISAVNIQANSQASDTQDKSLLKLLGDYSGNFITGSTATSYGINSTIYGDSVTPISSFVAPTLASVGVYSRTVDTGGYGGDTVGIFGQGSSGVSRNIGVMAYGKSGALGIGGAFYASNGTNNIGVIGTLSSTIPTATSAAILADNGAVAAPIFLARDNGATVFTIADGGAVTSTSTVTSTQYKLSALNTAPSSASDTGTVGEIRWANGFVYLCVATNTWQRAALASW